MDDDVAGFEIGPSVGQTFYSPLAAPLAQLLLNYRITVLLFCEFGTMVQAMSGINLVADFRE